MPRHMLKRTRSRLLMRITRLCALRRASFGCCARSDLLADLYLAGQDVHAVWQQRDDRVLDFKAEQPQLHLRRAIASSAPQRMLNWKRHESRPSRQRTEFVRLYATSASSSKRLPKTIATALVDFHPFLSVCNSTRTVEVRRTSGKVRHVRTRCRQDLPRGI